MGISGVMVLVFLLIAALPFAAFFIRFKKSLTLGEIAFEDYTKYARKIFTIFAVILLLLNLFMVGNKLLMLSSFAPGKALLTLGGIILQYVVFVFLGVLIVKAVFKILKINTQEDLTTKKIWIAIFVSAVIFLVIYFVLSFAIVALFFK